MAVLNQVGQEAMATDKLRISFMQSLKQIEPSIPRMSFNECRNMIFISRGSVKTRKSTAIAGAMTRLARMTR